LGNFRETPYKGNLRASSARKLKVANLHLEGNNTDLIIYLQAIRYSIKHKRRTKGGDL